MSNSSDKNIIKAYQKLAKAVITETVKTAKESTGKEQKSALIFIHSPEFELWCNMMECDAVVLRKDVKDDYFRKKNIFR